MTDTLTDIADTAESLCAGREHVEPRHEWDRNRNKKPLAPHKVVLPGLIQQLRDLATEGTTAGDNTGVRSVPDSRPPGAFEALALVAAIEFGAAWRCGQIGIPTRPTVESTITAIVGKAAVLHSDTQRDIRAELNSWRHQADVILGWEAPPVRLAAPCPVGDVDGNGTPCGSRGLVVVQVDGDPVARCVACGTRWSNLETPLLLKYAAQFIDASKSAAEAKRLTVREAKTAARAAEEEARKRRRSAA